MNPYELMFIVRPDLEGDSAVDQQIERYGRLIVDNGGSVTGVDKWGKRRFAYEVAGFTEGYYVVIQFKAADTVVTELNRIMRIADEIVRHLVVRLDEKKVKAAEEAAAAKAAEAAVKAEADSSVEAEADPGERAEAAQAEASAEGAATAAIEAETTTN